MAMEMKRLSLNSDGAFRTTIHSRIPQTRNITSTESIKEQNLRQSAQIISLTCKALNQQVISMVFMRNQWSALMEGWEIILLRSVLRASS